jgi:hypothetical protein
MKGYSVFTCTRSSVSPSHWLLIEQIQQAGKPHTRQFESREKIRTMPPSKRKTRVAAYVYDAKLQRVARALDNLSRVGAPMATGTSERCPPIGLAFKGDADGELHFPLGKPDEQKIKSRAAAAQQKQWEVRGDLLEQRNPRWQEFLKECLDSKRGALGISAAAAIELSLSKMVVQDAGARLQVRREGDSKGEGVFGSLVIAMPGTAASSLKRPLKTLHPRKRAKHQANRGKRPLRTGRPLGERPHVKPTTISRMRRSTTSARMRQTDDGRHSGVSRV